MNISFKKLLATRHATGMRVSLATIMFIEVVFGAVLLLGAISFDMWVYQTKVARSAEVAPEDIHGVTALNTKKLQEVSSGIRVNNEFIARPSLPLIQSPF